MVYGPNPTACRMQWCHGVVGRWLFGRAWGRSYNLEAFLIFIIGSYEHYGHLSTVDLRTPRYPGRLVGL